MQEEHGALQAGIDAMQAMVVSALQGPLHTRHQGEQARGVFIYINLVQGRGSGGRWLLVVYVLDEDGTLFVIHARSLQQREKRRHRRKR